MQKKSWRHPDEPVVAIWANELSERLGRSILEDSKPDWRDIVAHCTGTVHIRYDDGSRMKFRHAFALVSQPRKKVAVFTEHCGFFEFALLVDMTVREADYVVRHSYVQKPYKPAKD